MEGSPTNYGNLTSTKKLIIIGPGYFLSENNITQVGTATAEVSYMYLNPGSQGSEIIGLDFNGITLTISTSDIVVKRNKFSRSNGANPTTLANLIYQTGTINLGSGANNIVITQNYGVDISGQNYILSGLLITNNLISYLGYSGGETTTGTILHLHEHTVALIKNNIFLRGTVNVNRSTLTNNIMVNGFFEMKENMVSNNVGNGTLFGTAQGNKSNVDMSAVFVGTGTPDERFKLKVGSPAIGAGYGSTAANPIDAGMFSGTTPYRLSGLPGIPVIYFIDVQAVGSNADPIDVTVKVKSTN